MPDTARPLVAGGGEVSHPPASVFPTSSHLHFPTPQPKAIAILLPAPPVNQVITNRATHHLDAPCHVLAKTGRERRRGVTGGVVNSSPEFVSWQTSTISRPRPTMLSVFYCNRHLPVYLFHLVKLVNKYINYIYVSLSPSRYSSNTRYIPVAPAIRDP